MTRRVRIPLERGAAISGLINAPRAPQAPWAVIVLAHGAGAGMDHAFLQRVASGLAASGLAVVRFQFPYMEHGSRRPDRPAVAQAAVRAAVEFAGRRFGKLPLFAGGKSYGGRMTSQAQAQRPLPGVRGLFFLGFPLHPAGSPSTERAAHLASIRIPMLFMQGTRDALGPANTVAKVIGALRLPARLHAVAQADHAFHVPARSGLSDAAVVDAVLDVLAQWAKGLEKKKRPPADVRSPV
jgi:predicted alpha/beta-hydrolase family hydrolase